ncbi:MAG: GLUG motif-containing protein, partial [archaeon]
FNNLDANVYDRVSATGSYVGGLIGQNFSIGSTIRDSSADVNYILVIGNPQFIGGLVGSTDGNIYNSHSITQIDVSKSGSSDVYLGGLAGKASSINECYSDANINDSIGVYSGARLGGLVGSLNNDIKNSYSTGYSLSATKSSGHYVGGLVGFINSTSTIENSYSTIENILKGTNSYSGGLVGYESASTLINNSFSTSTITSTGGSYNGNLAGYSTCAPACITNSYYLSGEEVMLYSASPSSVSSSGVDYFKGNLTNEPMVNWSSLIWVSEANNYPQLIN